MYERVLISDIYELIYLNSALSCGLAPNITNADVLVNDDGAMYACHYGFSPSNINNRLLCQAGSWSLTDFQCLSTYCKHICIIVLYYTSLESGYFSISCYLITNKARQEISQLNVLYDKQNIMNYKAMIV